MGLPRRDEIARTLLIWTATAAVALLLAGCLHVVGGRAVMTGPSWARRSNGARAARPNRQGQAPRRRQCGKLAVPVDYNHLDGDVAGPGDDPVSRRPATRSARWSSIPAAPASPVSRPR